METPLPREEDILTDLVHRPTAVRAHATWRMNGLLKNANAIGTKRKWEERLRDAGVRLVGHRLIGLEDHPVDVARHRTAIVRHDFPSRCS